MLEEKDIYNKKKYYDKEIAPLIRELKIKCNLERMPMFVTVAVANSSKGTEYKNDMVMASTETTLEDNRIYNLLMYINDFQKEHPEHIKRAIGVLTEYLENVRVENASVADVVLSENRIDDIQHIVAGGDIVGIPKKEIEIEDDYWD